MGATLIGKRGKVKTRVRYLFKKGGSGIEGGYLCELCCSKKLPIVLHALASRTEAWSW
jgi:hypothetical protein